MEDNDESLEDLLHDIARSNYAGMLHDTERNQKYYQALRCALSSMKLTHDRINVLDIGSGTGILSMMAANAGANMVTACEMFQPMADTSKRIIELNGLANLISVVNKCSSDLVIAEDMKRQADVLVTEIFDTELIGEGVIPILNDAHKRLLKDNCKVIPEGADVKIQLIESSDLWCMNKLVEHKCNLDLPNEFLECPGTASAHELQVNQLYPDRINLLSESVVLKSFDFQSPYQHNLNSKISMSEKVIEIKRSGSTHAVLFWWDLHLSKAKNILLSMEPCWERRSEEYVWRDHWMQAVYYLKTPLNVNKGDIVFVKMYHDDYSVWFHVTKTQDHAFIDRPLCNCKLHTQWPRERFAMWNNTVVQSQISRYTKQYLGKLLIVGDVTLLPLYHWANDVTYLECSQSTTQLLRSFGNIRVASCGNLRQISNYDDIIIEPYFSSCLLPWQHLFKIWQYQKFFSNKCVKLSPYKAQLRAVAVNLSDLWRVRSPVSNIEDFNVSPFDQLMDEALAPTTVKGEQFETIEPYAMWEYKNRLLSRPTVLADFRITSPIDRSTTYNGHIHLTKTDRTDAVIIWMDFIHECDDEPWTTGLDKDNNWVNYSRQGVYFLKSPKHAICGDKIDFGVVLLPGTSDMMFRFA